MTCLGIVDEDLILEEDDDFYAEVDGSGGGESESKVDNIVSETSTSSGPLQITDGSISSVGTTTSLSIPSSTPSGEMTPLERARALAQSLGFSRSSGAPIINVPNLPPAPVTADGKIDTKAALNRARIIAAQMTGKGITVTTSQDSQSSQELHFMEEFEINDYPPLVTQSISLLSNFQ